MSEAGSMSKADYFKQRLDDQIGWLDRESMTAQRSFKLLRKIEIGLAAAIPVLVLLPLPECVPKAIPDVMAAVCGASIAVLGAISTLERYQQNWLGYRSACEALKREKLLYEVGVEPYDGENAFQILVLKVEDILTEEHGTWVKETRRELEKMQKQAQQANR